MTEQSECIDQSLREYFQGENEAVNDARFSESIDQLLAKTMRVRKWSFVLVGLLASALMIACAPDPAGFETLTEQFARWFGYWYVSVAGLLAILTLALRDEAT